VRVYVLGAGKVGTALSRALGAAGIRVTLRAMRRGLPRRPIDADLLVLAVRDPALPELASELAARSLVSRRTAVVHVAGALGPEVLAPLRGVAAGVAQAHPLLSFAATGKVPRFSGAHLLVQGDAVAVRRARELGRALAMVPRQWDAIDRASYHAAAGLVANGAAALAGVGAELLRVSGAPPEDAARALGPLLRSVADNVERLGLPAALTGPVRRGDVATVLRHLEAIERSLPHALPLYRASVAAQLPMARKLGDASSPALAELERRIRDGARARAPRRGKARRNSGSIAGRGRRS